MDRIGLDRISPGGVKYRAPYGANKAVLRPTCLDDKNTNKICKCDRSVFVFVCLDLVSIMSCQ